MTNVTEFPNKQRDPIAEMMGPKETGHAVLIDSHIVPGVVMHDRGDEIEFVLDHRFSYTFPREQAWKAMNFAFTCMAHGAGFAHFSALHNTQRPFAPKAANLADGVPEP